MSSDPNFLWFWNLPVNVFWLNGWKLSQPILQLNHISGFLGGRGVNRILLNASSSWLAWGLLETHASHGPSKQLQGYSRLGWVLIASWHSGDAYSHSCCLLPPQAPAATHLGPPLRMRTCICQKAKSPCLCLQNVRNSSKWVSGLN